MRKETFINMKFLFWFWGVRLDAEKRIVNLWLNKKGFFTINDINAGKNVIDILALKFKNSVLEKVVHVEVSCSLGGEFPVDYYEKKFESSDVKNKISEVVKNFVGSSVSYEKMLITNSRLKQGSIPNVNIIKFGNVLEEVFKKLDKQNYQNSITRTLQLVKYILLKKKSFSLVKTTKKDRISVFKDFLKTRDALRIIMRDNTLTEKIFKRFLRKQMKRVALIIRKLPKKERKELLDSIVRKGKKMKRLEYEKTLKSFFKE